MTNETANKWVKRFGKLEDITERKTSKGDDFITFKMVAKDFEVYGAAFNADVISQMKAAVGKDVWMMGVIEGRQVDGETKTSFKVTKFKVSEPKAETAGEEMAEAA